MWIEDLGPETVGGSGVVTPAHDLPTPISQLPTSVVAASRIVAGQASGDWMTRWDASRIVAMLEAYIAERAAAEKVLSNDAR